MAKGQEPYARIEKGCFLIATPEISSGLFYRGVILLCEHSQTGSFGLLVNKTLEVELPEEILSIEKIANPNVGLRAGGPVQTNQMMLLHTSTNIPQQTLEICDGVYLGGDLKFLQEAISDVGGPQISLCFGYSGWGAGQLEREFLDGHWYSCPANLDEVFAPQIEGLWARLLREMGGRYAAISMIPDDLSLN